MSNAAVETALQNLRPALAADGYDLRVGSVSADRSVEVILEAKPGACLECLSPDEILVQIIDTAVHEQDPGLGSVTLTKVGFETLADH